VLLGYGRCIFKPLRCILPWVCTVVSYEQHDCMLSNLQRLYQDRAAALDRLLATPPRYFLWSWFTKMIEAEDLSQIEQREE
jgi:hypothetical protein